MRLLIRTSLWLRSTLHRSCSLAKIASLVLLLVLLPALVQADSWLFEKKSTDRTFEFGNSKIVLTVDARKDQKNPAYILRIFKGGQLLAQYRNVAFEHLFASRDHSLFVGLSNDGLPGTAIVIFDDEGNLNLEIKHNVGKFNYCEKSVTRNRIWYNRENPSVEFKYAESGNRVDDITLKDCKGQRISLFKVINEAYKPPGNR